VGAHGPHPASIPCFDQGRFLADALDRVLAQTTPPCEIIVVDDGYADNLHAALPLLERFDVPATFFVSADGGGAALERMMNGLLSRSRG
jgi:peptidoglycan/xylan/chitin deacetylase (PgdA/CDA1 family)